MGVGDRTLPQALAAGAGAKDIASGRERAFPGSGDG